MNKLAMLPNAAKNASGKTVRGILAQPESQIAALSFGNPNDEIDSLRNQLQPTMKSAMKSYGQLLETNEANRKQLEQELGISRSNGENTMDAHLGDIALTSSLWAKNVQSMSMGFFTMVGELIQNPQNKEKAGEIIESSMDALKESQPEVFAFTKKVIDNFAVNLGMPQLGMPENLTKEQWLLAAERTVSALTAPARLVADIGHFMASKTVQYAQHPEQMAQDFMMLMENSKKGLEHSLKMGGIAVGAVSNLVKSLFDDYGIDKAWAGLGKIGQGIVKMDARLVGEGIVDILSGALEFGLEYSGAADLKRAYDAFRKGDFIGFAVNAAFGVTGLVGTVATFGAANAMLAGAKATIKRGTQELVEKGTKELVKGVGDDVLKAVSSQLDDVLSESLGKSFAELQKEYGGKIADQAKDEVLKALRSDNVVKHGLPENILDVLKKTDSLDAIDSSILTKLDNLVEEQVRTATEKYSKELLKHSQKAIEEQTKEIVGKHFDDLLNLSDDELVKRFTSILENADETLKNVLIDASERASILPKGINKFMGSADERCAKAYANRIRTALQGGKFDKEIVDAYTEEITQKITADMRSSFTQHWGKNVDEMLDTLEVNSALREGLAPRWKEAGERGFDKGLKPIRDVVRKKVAEEIASRRRFRRHGSQDDANVAEARHAYVTPIGNDGLSVSPKTDHHTMWKAKNNNEDPNEALRMQGDKRRPDSGEPDSVVLELDANPPRTAADAPTTGTAQLKDQVQRGNGTQQPPELPDFME